MENIEITLNRNKSFSSVNEIENLHIDLESEEKLLPVSDIQGKIDAYEQYLKEKDACSTYRFIFTIHPYCSNILFNHITEAVYNEGSDYTKMFLYEKEANEFLKVHKDEKSSSYATYKDSDKIPDGIPDNSPITRDTGYSNHINYNCGLDIFNNHLLRRKEFVCVNKHNNSNILFFNTLFDLVRDPWGNPTEGFTYNINQRQEQNPLHLYNQDSIYSFTQAIDKNLSEENGWIGFNNNTILDTISKDVSSPSINKIINNVYPCTFIDMYPTRKHYSFVPYLNKNRKRLEYNWEYLLTYPFKNVYDNFLVHDNERSINGILCDLVLPEKMNFPGTVDGKITIEQLLGYDDENPVNTPLNISFYSHINHNLNQGDKVILHIYNESSTNAADVYTDDNLVVVSTGNNGYDESHYFTLSLNEIITDLTLAYELNTGSTLGFRFEKVSIDKPCRYYLRKFRKIPNFENTKINVQDGISDEEIMETLRTNDFASSLNKLGFNKTIYGDDVSQIVYNDVKIEGLKDNLDREVSVIYLTIVKTNYGHDKWYSEKEYADPDVEYSHCFGKVSSGFDLSPMVTNPNEFNVHRQHNITKMIDRELINDIPQSSDKLEDDIKSRNEEFEFYGDIVELNEGILEETVLEKIQHRFNTAQREFDSGIKYPDFDDPDPLRNPFADLIVDDIMSDDFMNGGFMGYTRDIMCNGYWANIAPEGYYYQAHYPIRLKEFDTTVNTGYHRKIEFTYESGNTITTNENYYLELNGEVYLFRKDDTDNSKIVAHVGEVGGDDFTSVEIVLPDGVEDTNLNNYIMFKPNILKPSGAYDFGDIEQAEFREKTGRYIWRDILPTAKIPRESELYDSIFTNNAIYFYKDINFYLKRQGPYGDYGLYPLYHSGDNNDSCIKPYDLEFGGNEMAKNDGDYFMPGENNIC